MNRALSKCPVCAGSVQVTELSCESCGTKVQSAFERCRFCGVAPEHLQFVEMFLRSRGNISYVGAEMGISYPTVTKRLDAALAALGLSDIAAPYETPIVKPPGGRESDRRHILEMLDTGEITAEEAARRLQDL